MAQLEKLHTPLLAGHEIHSPRPSMDLPQPSAIEGNYEQPYYLRIGGMDGAGAAVRLDISDDADLDGSPDDMDVEKPNFCTMNGDLHTEGEGHSVSHREAHGLYSFLGEQPCLGTMPAIDPFRNHTERWMGLYEWVKSVVCLPLAVVRLILAILLTLIWLPITNLTMLGWRQREAPMPKWRRNLMHATPLYARSILFCFGFHWVKRTGKPARREVAPIVISNHVSYTDPIVYLYELFPSFVSSSSHDNVPFIGTIIRSLQVIYVDRLSPESRKHAIREIKRKALCNEFPQVMLFPEGTTTNGRSLIFFQPGAFAPGLPVQPVVLRYPYVHFDISWGRISVVKLFFRMLTQFHNFVEIEYLPVVYPAQKEKNDALYFARKVRNAMAKALNVSETDHTYGDLILATKASELNLIPESYYMVEMAKIERLFHITTKEAKDYLEKFAVMASGHSNGYVTEDQFLDALDLPKTSFSKQIFCFFDQKGLGAITFRQFLAGTAFIVKHRSFARLSKAAFESCDIHNQGFLSHMEVEGRLRLVFPDISDLQVRKLLKRIDTDADGSVNWDEFRTFLEKYPELLAIFLS